MIFKYDIGLDFIINNVFFFFQNNSIHDLNENDTIELWLLLKDLVYELSIIDDTTDDKELISCNKYILHLVLNTITSAEDIMCVYANEHLPKIILIFQLFYPKNIPPKVN